MGLSTSTMFSSSRVLRATTVSGYRLWLSFNSPRYRMCNPYPDTAERPTGHVDPVHYDPRSAPGRDGAQAAGGGIREGLVDETAVDGQVMRLVFSHVLENRLAPPPASIAAVVLVDHQA